jgi:spore maturation protein CgeB
MNIAFFGSSLVSAYWNGAATYYRGIIKGLHRLGYSITFFEPDAYDRQKHRDMDNPEWANVEVYEASERGVISAIKKASSADIIVKASGVGVYDELLEIETVQLKDNNNLIIYWDVDAPATLERIAQNPGDSLKFLIPQFDFVLTYGGGSPVVIEFLSLGAKHCIPIYNALDPETHYRVQPKKEYNSHLFFMGNRLPDRESRVEEFFFQPAIKLPKKQFVLGGNGWSDKAMSSNISYIGHVYTCDHNCINSSCLAALNINRDSMAKCGFSPPTRVFEAAGAGTCIITDAWQGIDEFLEPGEEVFIAHSGADVMGILQELTPAMARRVGLAGQQRILSSHTYTHRALQVHEILKNFR